MSFANELKYDDDDDEDDIVTVKDLLIEIRD